MLGTWLNVLTVLLGGTLGTLLGDRLPQRTRETVMNGLGLITIVVGLQMALTTRSILVPLACIGLGAVLGEWWGLEAALERLGQWFETRLPVSASEGRSVARAFVTASLVFCVGPMSILGSVQDGLSGDYHLLAIKALLDGITACAFAASMGPGVLLSALTVVVYQGGLALGARALAGSLGQLTREHPAIIEMTATGGVLILGIGLLLLDLKRIRVANLLPAVVLAPLVVLLLRACGVPL